MIKDLKTERHCIAAALRHPALLTDITLFIKEADFSSRLNRSAYGVIIQCIQRSEDISPFSVANKLQNVGMKFEELEGNLQDFFEELSLNQINEKAGLEAFKELKRVAVRREIADMARNLQKEMEHAGGKEIDEIISLADQAYTAKLQSFEKDVTQDFVNIYENVEEIIEERGNNPIEEFGMMGPFSRLNKLYGSLLRPKNMTLIGARSSTGKTAFSMYFLTKVMEQYGVPTLHMDEGEMSEFELQMRSVCMLSEGRVPMYLLETGKWRKNQEITNIVRSIWPKVKKLRYHYIDTSNLSPDEILSSIYRFYLSKVGRGNDFITHYDYFKSKELSLGGNEPEWQQMGFFVQKIKSFIKNRAPCPFWSSLQLNKTGIVGSKSANQLALDNTESAFSTSDRILWQMSHSFILRNKSKDELANEPNMGNMKLYNVGKRRFLGEEAQTALAPVVMPDNTLQDNHIMLESKSFSYREVGDLATLVDSMGQLLHNHHTPSPSAAAVAAQTKSEREDADLIA